MRRASRPRPSPAVASEAEETTDEGKADEVTRRATLILSPAMACAGRLAAGPIRCATAPGRRYPSTTSPACERVAASCHAAAFEVLVSCVVAGRWVTGSGRRNAAISSASIASDPRRQQIRWTVHMRAHQSTLRLGSSWSANEGAARQTLQRRQTASAAPSFANLRCTSPSAYCTRRPPRPRCAMRSPSASRRTSR